ncbi:tetratricopeptide repeat protein [Parvularcula maris]|uniref:DUF1570 domain-containing protein n=1 Tax=Parvularcula maris TaxID=2965077 RepID=A0A9X2LAZ4_9PROT|nr:hypothetical protein [Parvularcula maris]MCQ8186365.1 hypothetical protein [Parvularcula maris]
MYRCILPILVVLSCAGQAAASWVEVRSPNFHFAGQAKEADAVRLVRELELYRYTVLNVLGADAQPEARPVEVFGIKGARGMSKLTGSGGISGVYTLGSDGPVFIMDTMDGLGSRGGSRATALHEFAHHIMNSYSTRYVPRWYNEGFAEFLSSFEADGDEVTIGIPGSKFGYVLGGREDWIDWKVVLGAVRSYPSSKNKSPNYLSYFYGQSWLGVHYIQFNDKLNVEVPRYLELINSGTEPLTAFEQAFKMSVEEFGEQAERYFASRSYPVAKLQFTDAVSSQSISVRRLSGEETQAAQLRAMTAFVRDNSRHKNWATKQVGSYERKFGETLTTLAVRLALSFAEKDFDRSIEVGERALALFPSDPEALKIAGDAHFHRFTGFEEQLDKTADPSDLRQSRQYFGQQLRLDPTNPTANLHYIETYTKLNEKPDEVAIKAVRFLVHYRRNAGLSSQQLVIAEALSLYGDHESACDSLAFVAPWLPREEPDMNEEQLSAFKKTAQRVEAVSLRSSCSVG